MPDYLSMDMMFKNERVKSGFIKSIYQQIIDAGFDFFGEFYWEGDEPAFIRSTLEDISNWNQTHLEDRLRLSFPEEDDRYKQILFKREGYSEIRGIWSDFNRHLKFYIIVPEEDVLFYNKDVYYIEHKITPFILLAKNLWENGLVDAVQTETEYDDPLYNFNDIKTGRNIRFRPFAIISKRNYEKFPKNYFIKANLSEISTNGIYIENSSSIVKEPDPKILAKKSRYRRVEHL